MKRFFSLVALATLAAAGGARAQGGPVNRNGAPMVTLSHQVRASMAGPSGAAAPAPSLRSRIGEVDATIRRDVDQHRLSPQAAARLRQELKAIGADGDALDQRLAKVAASLP